MGIRMEKGAGRVPKRAQGKLCRGVWGGLRDRWRRGYN